MQQTRTMLFPFAALLGSTYSLYSASSFPNYPNIYESSQLAFYMSIISLKN
jgi:hypothetical protein